MTKPSSDHAVPSPPIPQSEGSSPVVRLLQSRPRRSLLVVLLFVIVAGVFGGGVSKDLATTGGFTSADAASARGVERIETATGSAPFPGIVLLVDGADSSAVSTAADKLAGIDGVAFVTPGKRSNDGSSALLLGTLESGADERVVATSALDSFEGDPAVSVGGQAVAGLQIAEQVTSDLARSELLAFPLLVLLTISIFGGRAAFLPLIVSVTTVFGTFLALTVINQVYALSAFALNLVIGLGLGLAVDYTLFLVSRYREELDRQGATAGAVVTTMRTAGRTVLYSAATVTFALITLTVFPMGFLRSMGIAGAVVAVVAAAAALIISPAIFALWGAKLIRKRKVANPGSSSGRWYRLSQVVMHRPGLVSAGTAAIMIALAVPALQAVWTPIDSSVVPTSLSARTVSDRIAQDYDMTDTTPVVAVVSGNSPQPVEQFTAEASSIDGVAAPGTILALNENTWQVNLPVNGDPAGTSAQQVVSDVRDLAEESGTDVLISGPAAEFVDQQSGIADALPYAAGLLVLLTLLVLWLMTGSAVLPVVAVVMNVLTVGVALGLLTFIYQAGRFTGILDYTPNGGIEPTSFLVAAALVFALSTDYGVFLFGRIKEARELGLSEREAVAIGLGRTGGVVTAAALLLAVAIGAFSTGQISFMQQIGLATAAGVLVDAFIVRSLLVPGFMGLLGKWNWWSPMWMRRIHEKIGLSEGSSDTVERTEPVAASTR